MEAPRIYPTFRFTDADAMHRWFTGTLGFTELMRTPETGTIEHAELAFGSSVIMIGQARDDAFAAKSPPPGGSVTYIAVDDPDALHATVVTSGTEIVEPPTDRDYPSREFIARDPDGNLWCFGTWYPKAP
ncbi:VOC family protein [Vannielia litorea]|uniref:VOC family protein n=1 Tax=Vannielia litorea TaxID=1217970 RepID=UPI001C98D26D|nr:VOC family protein [Vannielia litorea]MBY6155612.1 VOC family protein [Vannielia litorea]